MGVSPRASGPAGGNHEVAVAVHYALAGLGHTEARGMLGVSIRELKFQASDLGHPLDDIVVTGETADGRPALLEVQAKRSITFTAGNETFEELVGALVKAVCLNPEGEFAVATERTTGVIETGVQEVLTLARLVPTATAFFERLNLAGRSSNKMRNFVDAFRTNLEKSNVTGDDAVFAHLRRFQVLYFDHDRPGSASEALQHNLANQIFSTSPALAVSTLTKRLSALDAAGGTATIDSLRAVLAKAGVKFHERPSLGSLRSRIAEMVDRDLDEIDSRIGGVHLARHGVLEGLDEQISGTAVAALIGEGGVGKSTLLKRLAERDRSTSPILVLTPASCPSGGASSFMTAFGSSVTLRDCLADLYSGQSGTIYIDGLDRFNNADKRRTVADIIIIAREIGLQIVFSARTGWNTLVKGQYSETVLDVLKDAVAFAVPSLEEADIDHLSDVLPVLRPLLLPSHPAAALVRNPYRLKRLLAAGDQASDIVTEIDLARQWWESGGQIEGAPSLVLDARRVLDSMAGAALSASDSADLSDMPSMGITALDDAGELRSIATHRYRLSHDVAVDWALAMRLWEMLVTSGSEALTSDAVNAALPIAELPRPPVERGFALFSQAVAENLDNKSFPALIAVLKALDGQKRWLDIALLALVRSERAMTCLSRQSSTLLIGDPPLASRFIRRVKAEHGQSESTASFLGVAATETDNAALKLVIPADKAWYLTIDWAIENLPELDAEALNAALDLIIAWSPIIRIGGDNLARRSLKAIASALIEDHRIQALPWREAQTLSGPQTSFTQTSKRTAEMIVKGWAFVEPATAARWLEVVSTGDRSIQAMNELLEAPMALPQSVPDVLIAAIKRTALYARSKQLRHERSFGMFDTNFLTRIHGVDLFVALFSARFSETLNLVHELFHVWLDLDVLTGRKTAKFNWDDIDITIELDSYGAARGQLSSYLLQSAILALEHVCHKRLEDGESLKDIFSSVLAGRSVIAGAVATLLIDLVLCHAKLDDKVLQALLGVSEILLEDRHRSINDQIDNGRSRVDFYKRSDTERDIIAGLNLRQSRRLSLEAVLTQIAFNPRHPWSSDLKAHYETLSAELGGWDSDEINYAAPAFMVWHAARLLDPANYVSETRPGSEGQTLTFKTFAFPDAMERWRSAQADQSTQAMQSSSHALAMRMALASSEKDPRISADVAEAILKGTVDAVPPADNSDTFLARTDSDWSIRVSAAAFIDAFGSEDQKAQWREAIDVVYSQTLASRPDSFGADDITFCPAAQAVVGLLHFYAESPHTKRDEAWLRLVAKQTKLVSLALAAHPKTFASLPQLLKAATLRLGVAGSSYTQNDGSSLSEATSAQLSIELEWSQDTGTPPSWPSPQGVNTDGQLAQLVESYASYDWDTAERYLRAICLLDNPSEAMKSLVTDLTPWLDGVAKVDRHDSGAKGYRRSGYIGGIFQRAALYAHDWTFAERDRLVYLLIARLDDANALEAISSFIGMVDAVAIDDTVSKVPIEARTALWQRLSYTDHWTRYTRDPNGSMSFDLKPALAAFSMNHQTGLSEIQSYAIRFPDDIIGALIEPISVALISSRGCPILSDAWFRLIERSDKSERLGSVLTTLAAVNPVAPNKFWRRNTLGVRVVTFVDESTPPGHVLGLEDLLDAIAGAGIVSAAELRQRIGRK